MAETPIDQLLEKEVEWRLLPIPNVTEGLYATHEGVLDIGGLRLRCYTLNDGSRVFDADDVARIVGGEVVVPDGS